MEPTTDQTLQAIEADSFNAACALYWFCADHHDGQWSQLYSILSTLPYHPSPRERGPESATACAIYDLLSDGTLAASDVRTWIDAAYDAEHGDA